MTLRHRLSVFPDQVVVGGTAQGPRETLGHPWGLVLTAHEASDRAGGDIGSSRQIDGLPALRRDVLGHPADVVSWSALHCLANLCVSRCNVKGEVLRPLATSCDMGAGSTTVATAKRARPIFHPTIGAYLKHLRESRNWSQLQAVSLARQKGLRLGVGQLRFLEDGLTKHPDAQLLQAVAGLYRISYWDLAQRFVAANYGRDLVWLDGDQQSGASPAGGASLAERRELQQLRDEFEEYKAAHAAIVIAARRVLVAAAAGGEGGGADKQEPDRGSGGGRPRG